MHGDISNDAIFDLLKDCCDIIYVCVTSFVLNGLFIYSSIVESL